MKDNLDNSIHFENRHNNDCEHPDKLKRICEVSLSEDVSITTPITVNAYADPSKIALKCGGHEIIMESTHRHDTSKFKIRQKICLHIPIQFVAECKVGESQVEFSFNEN